MTDGFRLRRLALRVDTTSGPFGADLAFTSGLNILRAPNTSGKSTCIQAILFALGLEGMLGPAREVPLPHAMTHSIEGPDGDEHAVEASKVVLEISDHEDQILTIRRYAKHPRIDQNLVSVWTGPATPSILDDADSDGDADTSERRDFYVRRPGAAQREAGFHHFLARRLGWSLPEVPRYQGGNVPLYIETLAPLWFVEQKRGWTGIQAQTPTYLSIRDVRRRAFEFTLDLDVQDRAARIQALLNEQRELSARWSELVSSVEVAATPLGIAVEGLARRPTPSWDSGSAPRLRVSVGDGWVDLPTHLSSLRDELTELGSWPVPQAGETVNAEREQLREFEQELRRVSRVAQDNSRQLQLEEATADDAASRLQAIRDDIRRHQDVLILERMGAPVEDTVARDACPTCHKPLSGHLLEPQDLPTVLPADASIELLKRKQELFRSLLRDAERVLEARRARMAALQVVASDLRDSVRAIKDSLTAPSHMPSVADIERTSGLRRRLKNLDELRDRWLATLDELRALDTRYDEIGEELSELRGSDFSTEDRRKLTELERSFKEQLRDFDFQSCPVDQVGLDVDTYMPTHEGFELALDFSASDGIRIVWSYLIALLDVARTHETNHPGLIVFDEPRQQAAAEVSFGALLGRASEIASDDFQVVFATSESPETLNSLLKGIRFNSQEYTSKIIAPLESDTR